MDKKTQKKPLVLTAYLLLTAVLVVIDQITKLAAASALKGRDAYPIIDGVFELSYLENRGMAWGLFQGGRWIFLAGTILVLLLIGYVLWKAPLGRRFFPMRLTLSILAAGALGNLIDRLFRGYVIDFFYFSLIDFPIFNVADCYVVVSGIAFVIFFLFYYKDKELSPLLPERFRKKKPSGGEDA